MAKMKLPVNSSVLTALVIGVAAVVWIGSGLMSGGSSSAVEGGEASPAPEEHRQAVRVLESQAQDSLTTLLVNGQTKASRHVRLRAETSGRVEEIVAPKGQRVEAGDVLIRLALEDRQERLNRAEARVAQRQLEADAAARLAERDHGSRVRLAESRANLAEARADLAAIRRDIANIELRAPFAGVFNDHLVDLGDYVTTGAEVGVMLALDPMTVVASVSEREVEHIAVGAQAVVALIDGRRLPAAVTWVSQTANTATRTYSVEASLPNPALDIAEGMTAELTLPRRTVRAHRLSPAALTLDDLGRIGLKLVENMTEDGLGTVAFHPVDISAHTGSGLWVEGLPDQARIIVVGQEYVRVGAEVQVTVLTLEDMGLVR